MAVKFDLLGDPIPDNHGKRGANGHVATAENVSKVRTLLVSGMTFQQIAVQMGISVPTLRRHYFQSGKVSYAQARSRALAEARARNLMRLQEQADKGNVSALKAVVQQIDAAAIDQMDRDARRGDRGRKRPAEPTEAPVSQGKKAQSRQAALAAEDWLDQEIGRDGERVH